MEQWIGYCSQTSAATYTMFLRTPHFWLLELYLANKYAL
jgi:hypothetical protein